MPAAKGKFLPVFGQIEVVIAHPGALSDRMG